MGATIAKQAAQLGIKPTTGGTSPASTAPATSPGVVNNSFAPAGTVTVYTGTSKGGKSYPFNSSQTLTSLDPSSLNGVGPNTIQSVVVGTGAILTLYNQTGLTNSATKILTIQGPSYIEDLNEIDFGRNNAQSLSVQIPATSPGPTLVTLYSYKNYDTSHTYVSVFQYGAYDDLNNIGFPDSDMASIQVSPGTVVTLFANRGFGTYSGPSVTVPLNPTSTSGASISNTSNIPWSPTASGTSKNFYNQGDSMLVKPVTPPQTGTTFTVQTQQTHQVNTYNRAGHSQCDGNDWLVNTYSGGVVCSGVDLNGCPIIGTNHGSPTWPPGTQNAVSTATPTLSGTSAIVPPPYAVLQCTYNYADFQGISDVNTMLNPSVVLNPNYPGENYPSWVTPQADIQTIMDQVPSGVFATICNRQSSACPAGLINPTNNQPVTACSQMIATDALGQACQAWISRVGPQADTIMNSYCNSNTTFDCACILPESLPFYGPIFESVSTQPGLSNSGNRGCYWSACQNFSNYLIPTTYASPSTCPSNCNQIIENWSNTNSQLLIGPSTFNCTITNTTITGGGTGATGSTSTIATSGTTPISNAPGSAIGSTGGIGPVGSGPAVGPVGPGGATTAATPTSSSRKWLYIGIGIVVLLVIIGIIIAVIFAMRKPKPPP